MTRIFCWISLLLWGCLEIGFAERAVPLPIPGEERAEDRPGIDRSVDLVSQDSLFLNVVIPGADTVRTTASRHRVGAHTLPQARAFIDGEEVNVFENGAFVGMLDLETGWNSRTVKVVADGDTISKTIHLERPAPREPLPADPLVIDESRIRPASDIWLDQGDLLEVRFRGSPGHDASFSVGGVVRRQQMRELPPEETDGMEGVYVGRYRVQPEDHAVGEPIVFRLRRNLFRREKVESEARVTLAPRKFPRVVETTGERPFLNVGGGTDRLGGARLGVLQEGLRMRVTGKRDNMYRVRLSESLDGWLPVRFGELKPPDTPLPEGLAGSIATSASRADNRVILNLDEKVPWISRQKNEPARIEVDLFGIHSNTNWITHHNAADLVEQVTWDQVENDRYRMTIQLAGEHHWGYRVEYDESGRLVVHLNRPPQVHPDRPLDGVRIALDAGHGGSNRGAVGAGGLLEKKVNLDITRKVEQRLSQKGADVVMTRREDESVSMADRVRTIESSGAGLMLSIHANSIGTATDPLRVRGTSTYYRDVGSRPLSDLMYDHLLELGLEEFGVIGSFNFTLNAITAMPNTLIETGFLSHPEEEMKLADREFQQEMADRIVKGVADYLLRFGDRRESQEEGASR